jgi:hypothetical protein
VSNQVGVKGELEIRIILREFLGWGDKEDEFQEQEGG